MLKLTAIALTSASVGFGALFTTQTNAVAPAYGDTLSQVYQNQYLDHSETLFARADLNQDGGLDVDEFSALMLVKAELARLNGFVPIHLSEDVQKLPVQKTTPMEKTDRTRISAVSYQLFYSFAGNDKSMAWDEYAAFAIETFDSADRNADGVLRKGELRVMAEQEAFIEKLSA